LKHLVDRTRAPAGPRKHLYSCFVDFKKAYDLVHRDLLLECLRDLGVSGRMLGAIASMYWHAPMTVKSGTTLGATFNSSRGVKQGDPLSPLLFGLFIDRVERWLQERAPECGVTLGGDLVRVLLYADDLTLLADTPAQLQSLLNALQDFCAQFSLQVNVAKCAVVVFGRTAPVAGRHVPVGGWQYGGEQLPLLAEFRYLGITFHQTKGVSASVAALRSAGLKAMWGMLGKCKDMELRSLQVQVNLFDALVAPVLCYCSEVWAPSLLRSASTPDRCMDNDMHRVQTLFMRQLAGGVRKSTSRQLMLREFGCRPLARMWVQSMVSLWNRVVDMSDDCLMKVAMLEGVSGGGSGSWFSGFLSALGHFGGVPESGLCPSGTPVSLPVRDTLLAFDSWFYSGWRDLPADPRTAAEGTLCKYQQWFAAQGGPLADPATLRLDGTWQDSPPYVRYTAGMKRDRVHALSCFRLSAHFLEVETMKWARPPPARSERVCGLCSAGVGDELHMLAECPGYSLVRDRHSDLFECVGGLPGLLNRSVTSEQFRSFMLQEQWRVADFLYECVQLRWENPPAYLVAPVQGDDQMQEADIPELSQDEFESLLDSSDYAFYSVSDGFESEFPP
jgi:hypothetical protein